MSEQARVMQLLEEALSSGRTPEEVCANSPDLLNAVRARWEHCRQLDGRLHAFFPSASPSSGSGDSDSAIDKVPPARSSGFPLIPGYVIEEELGRGGVGVVFGARHLGLRRRVALKMLLSGAYAGRVERARFMREAQAVAALHHAHVVQVHDVGEHETLPFFTMELMDGGSLAARLGGVPMPASGAASLLIVIADAVHAAHRAGIVHRDLKPANVLLTTDGTPKVSDFGLALQAPAPGEEDFGLTLSGARVGTPSYMAPEQAAGQRHVVGPASDIYALGAILYEMLTGRPPFRGESAAETERQVIADEPVPPKRLNARVPRDLETICLKCLQKDANRRYATADALVEELRRFQNGEPIVARRTIWLERAAKWIKRRPALATAIFATVIIVLSAAGGSFWFFSQRAATNAAVAEDLQEAQREQQQSQWAPANSALELATVRLGNGGPAALRDRLTRVQRDANLVRRLDDIRMSFAGSVGGLSKVPESYLDRAAAFQDAGLGGEKDDPQVVADRIKHLNIRTRLVGALDDWSEHLYTSALKSWVLDIARRADQDPTGLRDAIRNPAVWNDGSALAKVAATATPSTIALQPASFLIAVAARLKEFKENTGSWDEMTQTTHPDDFFVNLEMGYKMAEARNRPAELAYFQTAVALRPDASVAHNNLGIVLEQYGRASEAIVQFRQAIRYNPTSVAVHKSLGYLLVRTGKRAEGIAEFEEALRYHPNEDEYLSLGDEFANAGEDAKALACVQQLLSMHPKGDDLAAAQKSLYVRLLAVGRLDEALADWREELKSHPMDRDVWIGYAQFCLRARETEYEQARQTILEMFGNNTDPRVCEVTARACLLMPTSDEELQRATAMIDRAIGSDQKDYRPWMAYAKFVKGLAEYRAGHFQSALTIMTGDAARVLGPAPGLVTAMAQYRLGHVDQAHQALNKAISVFDWGPNTAQIGEVWIYHVLRREAEAMMTTPSTVQ